MRPSLNAARRISDRVEFAVTESVFGLDRRVSARMESALHEACHVVTLGAGDENPNIDAGIRKALYLRTKEEGRDNELLSLAVELVLLRQLGLLVNRDRFLDHVLVGQSFLTCAQPYDHRIPVEEAKNRIEKLEGEPTTQALTSKVVEKLREWARRWPR